MKMLRIIMILLGALLLTNCSGDFEQETGIVPSHSGQVSFLFGLQQDDASVVQTRGSKPEQITRMWYAIANERGEIIKPLYQKLEENFSKLTIEGLSMGDYTVVFLATTSEEEDEAVKEPEKLSDDWLINHAENAPLDAVYFYKKIELHIGRDHGEVDGSMETDTAFVRTDCIVELYTITEIGLNFPFIVYPSDTESEDTIRFYQSFYDLDLFKFGMLIVYIFDRKKNFFYCLKIL